MSDWTTATNDVRDLLADNETDKLRWRKKVFGKVDGTNTKFKTFEKRRLTNFTSPSGPLGVWVDDTLATVGTDDLEVGEFTLSSAPSAGALVEATYYLQWFIDTEIDTFLQSAANWLGYESALTIQAGLRPAAKYYSAQEAYHYLALRWANRISEEFRLEDAPPDGFKSPVDMYRQLAKDAQQKANQLRDDFYKGKGQANKPISTSIAGAVRQVVPRR